MSTHGSLGPSGRARSNDDLGYLVYELAGLKSITYAQATRGRTDEEIESMLDHFANMVRRACELVDAPEVARLTGLSEERLLQVLSSEKTPPNWWPH